MEIKRTFYAIGHGGFFVEQIENYTIVFDCGSTNKPTINKAIERAFPIPNTKIDAVFISHFHMDHINGLGELIKKHNIEKLFMPFLSRIERLSFVIDINNKKDLFEQKFILEPELATKEISGNNIQIIYIFPEGETSTYNFPQLPSELISGCELNISPSWKYLPSCQQVIPLTKITEITELFSKKSIPASLKSYLAKEEKMDINILIKDIISNRASLKKDLNDIKQKVGLKTIDENTYSMMLYSGPSKDYPNNSSNQTTSHPILIMTPPGCLYFADQTIASENAYNFYQKHYSQYLPYIGTILIPHHGSKKSFNHNIINKWQICIIAAAEKDKNNHPDYESLKQTLNKRGILIQLGTQEDIRENILINEDGMMEHSMY